MVSLGLPILMTEGSIPSTSTIILMHSAESCQSGLLDSTYNRANVPPHVSWVQIPHSPLSFYLQGHKCANTYNPNFSNSLKGLSPSKQNVTPFGFTVKIKRKEL